MLSLYIPLMRNLFVVLFLLCILTTSSLTYSAEEQETYPSPFLHRLLNQNINFSSLQFAIYSYKPKLGDLNNILQSVGITKTPIALMPTLSIILQHRPELDSRFEIGYWRTELQTPAPTSLSITASLVPISYQLIYRPVMLHQYLPIYFGAGIGLLHANFDGDMVDLLEEQGFMLSDSGASTTGYVIVGLELYEWQSQPNTRTSIANNLSFNLEFKRILKTLETTGTTPLKIILDGTAIGLGVRSQF